MYVWRAGAALGRRQPPCAVLDGHGDESRVQWWMSQMFRDGPFTVCADFVVPQGRSRQRGSKRKTDGAGAGEVEKKVPDSAAARTVRVCVCVSVSVSSVVVVSLSSLCVLFCVVVGVGGGAETVVMSDT